MAASVAEPAYLNRGSLLEEEPLAADRLDAQETKSIQEQARERAEQENRTQLRLAREDMGRIPTKGELTRAAGAEEAPLRFTRTRGVKSDAAKPATRKPGKGAPVRDEPIRDEEDLTPEWQRALDALPAKKKR